MRSARRGAWEQIKEYPRRGTKIFLTAQPASRARATNPLRTSGLKRREEFEMAVRRCKPICYRAVDRWRSLTSSISLI